jgi:hypothetical protein
MAKYSPFAERAGMQNIAEQPPSKEVLRIVEVLERFGFNFQLLGSEKYVLNKLQTLSIAALEQVRESFSKHCHTRFMKYLFPHQVFGRRKDYVEAIKTAGVERLAHLIKLCGVLLQDKVYLFWSGSLAVGCSRDYVCG